MAQIDPGKIELADYFHNSRKNPLHSNTDDRNIEEYDSMLRACSGVKSIGAHQRGKKVVSSLGVDIRRFEGVAYLENPKFVYGQTSFYQHDLDNGVIDGLKPELITCVKSLLYVPYNTIKKIKELKPFRFWLGTLILINR